MNDFLSHKRTSFEIESESLFQEHSVSFLYVFCFIVVLKPNKFFLVHDNISSNIVQHK